MKRVDQINIANKRVLIRADFNVPISNGKIQNYFRLDETIKTIKYCLDNNAKIIIMSHLGRPKNIDLNYYTLQP